MNNIHVYDMIIVGGGPGGYTAALYAARAGLDTVVLEKLSAGGQMAQTSQIDNYSGFELGIDGFLLADKMQQQAERFGAKTEYTEVLRMDLEASPKIIETSDGEFYSKTVVIASGANPKNLGLENEYKLMGRGVAYCASCDGMFYRGKTVAVVGGGNSAVSEALHLTKFAKTVTLIHRRNKLKAEKVLIDKLMNNEKVNILWNCVADEILGQQEPFPSVTGLRLRNVNTDSTQEIKVDGVFVAIGRHPNTEIFANQLVLDKSGYIVTKLGCCQTSVEGVFAAGDVVSYPFKQAITAAGMGCSAALEAVKYLENQK
jgi:thioredoxin reductase (NADPH)